MYKYVYIYRKNVMYEERILIGLQYINIYYYYRYLHKKWFISDLQFIYMVYKYNIDVVYYVIYITNV